MLAERVKEWTEEWKNEGIQQGMQKGMQKGMLEDHGKWSWMHFIPNLGQCLPISGTGSLPQRIGTS